MNKKTAIINVMVWPITESNEEGVEIRPLGNVFDVEKIASGDAAQFVGAPEVKSLGQARNLFYSKNRIQNLFSRGQMNCISLPCSIYLQLESNPGHKQQKCHPKQLMIRRKSELNQVKNN
jgi:hypothetical protein